MGNKRILPAVRERGLLASLLFLILWGAAFSFQPAAAATVSGAAGLLQIPSADALPQGRGHMALGFDAKGLWPSFTYGLLAGLEAGVTARPGGDVLPRVKYAVAPETSSAPGLAVGIEGRGVYAVLSRRLESSGVRVHVGVGSGGPGPLFAGLEVRLRSVTVTAPDARGPAPAVSLLVDYDGRAAALGARLDFATGFTLSAGVRAGHGAIGSAAYTIQF